MYLVKRNKIYHLFYRNEQGKLVSQSTKCQLKVEAKKFVIDFFKKPIIEEKVVKQYTYAEFKDFYKGYALSRFAKSYQAYVKIAFDQFEKVIDPNIEISKITPMDVHKFIAFKRLKAGERLVNGYLRTLQGAFERAVEFEMLDRNIFKKIKKLKPPQNQPLFLTKEEFEQVLQNENEEKFRLIYRFAVYTGMRMGEIRFLRWGSINFETDMITVVNHEEFTTKSKKSRNIPLHRSLKDDLLIKKGNPEDYIFIYKHKMLFSKDLISNNFKAAIRRAELNDKYHFHTLRHTFASWLVQKGVSIYEVSKLLGHADIKTTEIYAHLKENNLRNSVNLL